MKGTPLNLVLLACLILTGVLNWAVEWNTSEPNFEFFPEMVRSVPFNSFSANPNFSDGKTLQCPPEGAIPRGFAPIHYGPTPEEAVRAGEELSSSFPADDQDALERGASIYMSFCAHCHGGSGAGDGAVVRRGYPGPPSLLAEQTQTRPDGTLFHIISYGQGNMPGHAAQISQEDRWKVISYIRSLQRKNQVTQQPDATRPES